MCHHCLNSGGCIHCRELRAENERLQFQDRARVRQRTDAQRGVLGLMTRRMGRLFSRPAELPPVGEPARLQDLGLLPGSGAPRKDARRTVTATPRALRQLGNSVLPCTFTIAGTTDLGA